MRILLVAVLCAGCVTKQMQQTAMAVALDRTTAAQQNVTALAKAVADIATEVSDAVTDDRVPEIGDHLQEAAIGLEQAHSNLNEVGETLIVVQEDIGLSTKPVPQTQTDRERFRAQYRAVAKLWAMAMDWGRRTLPGLGAVMPSPQKPTSGWSATEIAGLITAITVGAGALGLGAKKGVGVAREYKRRGEAEKKRSKRT